MGGSLKFFASYILSMVNGKRHEDYTQCEETESDDLEKNVRRGLE